jgi:hypothetical protein
MLKKFSTETPQLSDATIAGIRAAAHQFVRAGGTIFPSRHDNGVSEHIANTARDMDGKRALANEAWSDSLEGLEVETREAIYQAATRAISDTGEAGFLFGAFVGLELAGLTFGQLATIPTIKRPKRSRR